MTLGSFFDIIRRTIGNLLSVFKHDDVVGNFHDHRHIVFDQKDRCVGILRMLRRNSLSTSDSRGLRPAAGSSRHKSSGPVHMARGDFQPALRAIRKIASRIVGAIDEIGLLQPEAR